MAARRGLIEGRMDGHYPVAYVNAVSYAGLASAAMLAKRSSHDDLAAEWLALAKKLKMDWVEAFTPTNKKMSLPKYATPARG